MGLLAVYDALTGQLLSRAVAHSSGVNSVIFTPDGTRVGTTSNDCTVKVWTFSEDLLSPLLTLTGHKEGTSDLVFSLDGEQLVSCSTDDGTVRVWDISPDGFGRLSILDLDELIALANSRLTRTLTAEECQQFLHMEHCP
jgi:WD40 repeat protein